MTSRKYISYWPPITADVGFYNLFGLSDKTLEKEPVSNGY